uniref:AlNc14C47G3789 protein n=1 Tax=Albugo laibachii Nc14 TaxID=890382 RepID=F0WAS5_9STRA|nr:AlNc14C47G3789 [Albugo laibachii Nc14]|eukprot:CCA18247.1 AlNc14C47G3789 [Albugo laibachii Nc14]
MGIAIASLIPIFRIFSFYHPNLPTFVVGSLMLPKITKYTVYPAIVSLGGGFGAYLVNVLGPNHQLKPIAMVMQQFDYFNESIVPSINNELEKIEFITIESMQSHQYGKMSPGLLRQATCVRLLLLSNTVINMEILLVKPIWSSLKPGNTRRFDITSALGNTENTGHILVYSGKHAIFQKPATQPQPNTLTYTTQQPTLPLESTTATNSSSSPFVTANSSRIDISEPRYDQGHPDGLNQDSTKPQQAPMISTTAISTNNNEHPETAASLNSSTVQPSPQPILSASISSQ